MPGSGVERVELEAGLDMEWFRAEWLPVDEPALRMELGDEGRLRVRVTTGVGRRVRLMGSEAWAGPGQVVAMIEVPLDGRVTWDLDGWSGSSGGYFWLEEGWNGMGDGEVEGANRQRGSAR
jgi:hypothetical protein